MYGPRELTELCEEQWPQLVRLLSLYTGDHDAAEELAQETLAGARLPTRRKVTCDDEPAAWLYRVAIQSGVVERSTSLRARARGRHGSRLSNMTESRPSTMPTGALRAISRCRVAAARAGGRCTSLLLRPLGP